MYLTDIYLTKLYSRILVFTAKNKEIPSIHFGV